MGSRRMPPVYLACIMVASMLSCMDMMPAEGKGGSFGGGDGSAADPYVIEDVWDLQNMSADLDAHYVLGSDIDASATASWNSGAGFEPVGTDATRFTGSLDGRNRTVKGLFIERSTTDYVGLFGALSGSVRNVGLVDTDTTGNSHVGGLVGRVSGGAVHNAHATGNVTGESNYVGGLVGSKEGGMVSSSYSMGKVTGKTQCVGGLVGDNYLGTVSNSYATGHVVGSSNDVGGLVGGNHRGTVSNSYATGDVTGSILVGGLVGDNSWGTVNDSYATGNVNATGDVLGSCNVGGLVGLNNQGTVSNSYATGDVTGSSGNIGGLVGCNDQGTVRNCFWDKETSGVSSSDGGIGKTTSEMQKRRTFTDAGWDFTFVWFIIEDVTRPTLRWQDTIPPTAHAGPDSTIDAGEPVTFDGGGSTDNVGIINYTWRIEDGPEPVLLYVAFPTYTFKAPGVHTVVLRVADAAGLWHEDVLVVSVIDAFPPVADAGPDQRVPVGSEVALDASLSTDNLGISACSWAFTYDGQARTLEGAVAHFTFAKAGTYMVTLTVADLAGNTGDDALVITVVGTGTVTGIVLDKGGRPVEGATVRVTAADGSTFDATTAANGTFSLDVPHGAFDWKVGKKGYRELSGSGSVGPMDATELDFADTPLKKEEEDSPGAGPVLAAASVVLAALAATSRRRL